MPMRWVAHCLLLMVLGSVCSAQDKDGTFTNTLNMSFMKIPAGEFVMGRSQTYREILERTTIYAGVDRAIRTEVPVHDVHLDAFQIQVTEVTQGQWEALMHTRPWDQRDSFTRIGSNYPATGISWNDAQEFCRRLSLREGRTYRLPTEAEWEYACRAGTTSLYHFGDDSSELVDYGWTTDNAYSAGEEYAHRVARQKSNRWGLHDMHGNVWEWCSDWYGKDYYSESPAKNPKGPESGDGRVIRGGSWRSSDTHARSAFRFGFEPTRTENDLGFRVVLEIEANASDDDGNE